MIIATEKSHLSSCLSNTRGALGVQVCKIAAPTCHSYPGSTGCVLGVRTMLLCSGSCSGF